MATDEEQQAMRAKYAGTGFGYGHAKQALLEKFMEYFGPIRERKKYYEQHPEEVNAVLDASEKKLRPQVDAIMTEIRKKVGIIHRI